ncbi:MAG TPA: hypothetical protein VME43_27555 [Bryobacteraceae bacterium]|nr:hypothetical protein [Bryobacteraceae bacterium]
MPLSETDYTDLAQRWIDKPHADAAKIRRVDSDTGRRLVGRRKRGSYEGLAIPYFLPSESAVRNWRLRRDHPETETKDGKSTEREKYLSPLGRKNLVYFSRAFSRACLNQSPFR